MEKINHNSLCETETYKVGMTDNENIKDLECCTIDDLVKEMTEKGGVQE